VATSSFVLFVEAFEMPELDPNPPFHSGRRRRLGPDVLDQSKESSFLALQYQQSNLSGIPSIDFVAGATGGN
jgi:hypothetical protein